MGNVLRLILVYTALKRKDPQPTPTVEYKTEFIHLSTGDVLFLYTDGITETMNAQRVIFSEKRLLEVLSEKNDSILKSTLDRIYQSAFNYRGESDESDDIAMLAIRYKGGTA